MALCLTGKSADRVLEVLAQTGGELEPVSASNLEIFSANIDDVRDLLGEYQAGDLPLHLLVGRQSDRRTNDVVVARTTSINLPDGAIKRLDEGLYVSSPELCLLQQANDLHVANLCQMLGRYFATKAPSIKDPSVLVDRSPLTSDRDVEGFLAQVPTARGIRKVREALRWTAPAAASPQETNLQLVLTLPPSYGGFGLPKPVMNDRVPLKGVAKGLLRDHVAFYPDVSWPEKKIGCEYQGDEHRDQLPADCSRALAAEAMGYKLWYLTAEQLYSAEHMDYVARRLASLLERRVNSKTWPSLEQVDWLLRVLRGRVIPKPSQRFAVRAPRAGKTA